MEDAFKIMGGPPSMTPQFHFWITITQILDNVSLNFETLQDPADVVLRMTEEQRRYILKDVMTWTGINELASELPRRKRKALQKVLESLWATDARIITDVVMLAAETNDDEPGVSTSLRHTEFPMFGGTLGLESLHPRIPPVVSAIYDRVLDHIPGGKKARKKTAKARGGHGEDVRALQKHYNRYICGVLLGPLQLMLQRPDIAALVSPSPNSSKTMYRKATGPKGPGADFMLAEMNARIKTLETSAAAAKEGRKVRECAMCGATATKMQTCSMCRRVYYCGPQCQKADWKMHKLHCKKKGSKKEKM